MKKGDLEKISLFTAIAIFFIVIFLFLKPSITGFVVYTPGYYNWTFDNPDDYIYDDDLVEISDNSVRLKLQEEEYTWTTLNYSIIHVSFAEYNGEDKTDKVNLSDDKEQRIKNKILNVVFDDNVENGVLILHLIGWGHSNVFACEYNVSCDDGYGSVNFHNSGWYNITLDNFNSDRLGIATDDEVWLDYLEISKEWEEENIGINLTYPESASIETKNIDLPTVNQLNLFSRNDELDGQEVNYYYSEDNGENWNEIGNNGSLPYLEQIKIKAELDSDKESTPILYNMVLTYEYCNENWNCSEWSKCYENGTKTRYCNDINECETEENKPAEIENCVYFPRYYDINESKTISLESNTNTIINASDLVLDLISEEDSVDININIEKSLDNLTDIGGKGMIKNVNISAGKMNIKEGIIKIYYNEEDLGNINEDSLKIYYYNNGIWEELNSSINKDERYVYANVEHFSVYGVFGEIKETSSSSSGGGGGGSSTFRRPVSEEGSAVQEIKEESTESIPKNDIIIEENKEENNFESFTGLVIYNAKKAKVTVPIGLGILILMIAFFIKAGKFNRKKR